MWPAATNAYWFWLHGYCADEGCGGCVDDIRHHHVVSSVHSAEQYDDTLTQLQ